VLGAPVRQADPDFVRAETGYAIGGVPPLGHAKPLVTLFEGGLLAYDVVWAAAGTPHAVFALEPARLAEAVGGRVVDVAQRA
jgi:prolyl-tRNA editing enzyme YbaK/EbsC (Cys-tRNA(Pro) deacylase)